VQVTKVRIDGQFFILADTQPVERLKEEIVRAARAGGAFVDFATIGRGLVSVFVSNTLAVRFQAIERTPAQVAEWTEHPPRMDATIDLTLMTQFDM
jgi:hypothetical protein